ncbi:hypothetical protein SSX86_001577 [Deinandra increscens subsp. villosa]|uniref:Uncharacterized protein n=1 Tax=Deinandra increscens subsp. villosa TaxID=3103831 RepID=A0AAP0H9C5_9ASTR
MADRFFPNNLPEFVKEEEPPPPETTANPLLSLPYNSFSHQLKQAAFNLKETIVMETWGSSGKRLKDYTVYTGALGTAFLVFKSYQITHSKKDLDLCKDIVKACDSASFGSRFGIKDWKSFAAKYDIKPDQQIKIKYDYRLNTIFISDAE